MSRAIRIQLLSLLFVLLSSTVCMASFQIGDEGEDVSAIQSALTKWGYPVEVDGYFGSAMEYQVKNFQAVWGLEPDGIVGEDTYYAIMGKNIMVSRGGSTAFIRRLVQTSFAYIGVPYVFGGTTPGGFDCSGYVQYVFAKSGVDLPRLADEQFGVGQAVSYRNLRAGDLVFFTTYAAGASHVGIYLGNNEFINATTSSGVQVSSLNNGYWGSRYIGARRVL
ncbi:MAG: C40 family peptidase [Selenomonadales bacterium]|nr:C40 family peptidase [Selenomonadales bacterium]